MRDKKLLIGRVLMFPLLLMIFSGVLKIMHTAQVVEGFAAFGYPMTAITPIGIAELACVALYLFPATSIFGAILTAAYLGGAVASHVRAGQALHMPILVGVILWISLVLREPRLQALLPLRKKS